MTIENETVVLFITAGFVAVDELHYLIGGELRKSLNVRIDVLGRLVREGSKANRDDRRASQKSVSLKRETGWWGAFVIGLAGTILVTGIAPVMVTSLGASSIPITVFITITGWLLCLFLAELAAIKLDPAQKTRMVLRTTSGM